MTDAWKTHRWSGWPGAFCLDCHAEDPWEYAVATHYDPITQTWDDRPGSAEAQAACENIPRCPASPVPDLTKTEPPSPFRT